MNDRFDRKKLDDYFKEGGVPEKDAKDISSLVCFIGEKMNVSIANILSECPLPLTPLAIISICKGQPQYVTKVMEKLERKLVFANQLGLLENADFGRYKLTEEARKKYFYEYK